MAAWQYAKLEVKNIHGKEGWRQEVTFYGPNGNARESNGPTLVALNELGAVGWEVISTVVPQTQMFSDHHESGVWYQGANWMLVQFWLKRRTS